MINTFFFSIFIFVLEIKLFQHNKMSKITSAKNNKQKKVKHQNKYVREQTETETIDIITLPPSDITSSFEEDIVSQDEIVQYNIQEEFQDDVNSDTETKIEVEIDTSEKNSWVWPFYCQIWTKNDNIITICKVEIVTNVQCDKRYKTGSSTGNLIIHLLRHGITKNNPHPQKVLF